MSLLIEVLTDGFISRLKPTCVPHARRRRPWAAELAALPGGHTPLGDSSTPPSLSAKSKGLEDGSWSLLEGFFEAA
jgi:hypothetical protein